MNNILEKYNYIKSHKREDELIDILIDLIDSSFKSNNIFNNVLLSTFKQNGDIDYTDIFELIGWLHQKKKEKRIISETNERKHFGIYYTKYEVAKLITDETFSLMGNNIDYTKIRYLEPCAGTGIFIIAYLDHVFQRLTNLNKEIVQKIVNNIYFSDIDEEAINILTRIIPKYIRSNYDIEISIKNKNCYIGNILFNTTTEEIRKNDPREIFKVREGFDVITTNPPYKLLKANSNHYKNSNKTIYKEQTRKIIDFIRRNNTYKYNEGTLNLYRLFVEEILENYTHKKGKIGLLIPVTLLNDKQSTKIRNRIIDNYLTSTFHIIPEKNEFFPDICQSFCFFSIDKNSKPQKIKIRPKVQSLKDFDNNIIEVDYNQIKTVSDSNEIITEEKIGWNILNKIHKEPKLKSFLNIKNLRGELDLTLHKNYITKERTNYLLIKGKNINEFRYSPEKTYVNEEFLKKTNGKNKYIKRDRIICQQISNIHSDKRLKFAKIPKNLILGNSCNFISTDERTLFYEKINLDFLLGLLNSLILDWRFKATSSNNHISNYELAELPIAVNNRLLMKRIEETTKKILLDVHNSVLISKLNLDVFKLYKLNKKEISYIIKRYNNNEVIQIIKSSVCS